MKKFDEWNEVKKETQKINRKLGLKQRDIFWAKIGENIGDEEYGKGKNFTRPIIIIRQLTNGLFIGIPLTTTIRENNYFHTFEYDNKTNGIIKNSAMILQVKVFSIKRLMNKTGTINKDDFAIIIKKLQNLISPI